MASVSAFTTMSRIHWLVAVLLIALFGAMHNDDIWSVGMDFPHHVALASYIAEHASLPLPSVARLSEMAVYPPGSHVVAAITSIALGSPVAAVKLVADLSLVITWMLAGVFLSFLGQARALISLAIVIFLMVANRVFPNAEVIGNEMIVNEFYSQLVGQALVFATLAACAQFEKLGKSPWLKYSILALACAVVVNVHLLPTAVLFSTFFVLWFMDVAVSPANRRIKRILLGSALLVAGAWFIYSSEYTSTMRSVSQMGGSIPLRWITSLGAMAVLALVTFSVCIWLTSQSACNAALRKHPSYLAYKYVGALGTAAGGLCLLQIVLFSCFDVGSTYACFKYAFLLGTILLLSVAIIVSGMVVRTRSDIGGHLARMRWLVPTCAAVFGFLAAEITVQVPKLQSTQNLSRLLAAATAYAGDPSSLNRQNIAVGIRGVYPAGDYLVSLVGLGANARSPLTLALLHQQTIPSTDELGDIITSAGSSGWDIEACRKAILSDGLIAVDGHCAIANASTHCRSLYDFTNSGGIEMQKVETLGFSVHEIDGTWTEGNEALLSCKLSPSDVGRPLKIAVDSAAFLFGKLKSQSMIVSVGSKEMTVNFDAGAQSKVASMEVDPSSSSELVIRLTFPDAASPAQLGLSGDTRELGVKIRSISIE